MRHFVKKLRLAKKRHFAKKNGVCYVRKSLRRRECEIDSLGNRVTSQSITSEITLRRLLRGKDHLGNDPFRKPVSSTNLKSNSFCCCASVFTKNLKIKYFYTRIFLLQKTSLSSYKNNVYQNFI